VKISKSMHHALVAAQFLHGAAESGLSAELDKYIKRDQERRARLAGER
jgi:hypothetical protein